MGMNIHKMLVFFVIIFLFYEGLFGENSLSGRTFSTYSESEFVITVHFKAKGVAEIDLLMGYNEEYVDNYKKINATYKIIDKETLVLKYSDIEDTFIYGDNIPLICDIPPTYSLSGLMLIGTNKPAKSHFTSSSSVEFFNLYEKVDLKNTLIPSSSVKEKIKKHDKSHKGVFSLLFSGNLNDFKKIVDNDRAVLNYKSHDGDSLLIFLLKYKGTNYSEMVKYLLENGSDANDQEIIGKTFMGNSVLDFAFKANWHPNISDQVFCENREETVNYLLNAGARKMGGNLCKRENGQIVKPNMRKLVDIFSSWVSTFELSEKEKIKMKGNKEYVCEIDLGALLFTAIKNKDLQAAEFIIRKGVDLNKENSIGLTPLSIAKKNGLKEIEELLKKYGAKD